MDKSDKYKRQITIDELIEVREIAVNNRQSATKELFDMIKDVLKVEYDMSDFNDESIKLILDIVKQVYEEYYHKQN